MAKALLFSSYKKDIENQRDTKSSRKDREPHHLYLIYALFLYQN